MQMGSAVEKTRSQGWDDQAWVEQKNGAVVRRIVGYQRFEELEAAAMLVRLYHSVRLFVNVFQPSFKLADKSREGAKVAFRFSHSPMPLLSLPLTRQATHEGSSLRREVSGLPSGSLLKPRS